MATHVLPTTIVHEVLGKDNYENWNSCIKSYLLSQDLWDIVEGTNEPPKPEDDGEGSRSWEKRNAAALHAIQISCSLDIFSQIKEISSAKMAWEDLARKLQPQAMGGNPSVEVRPGAEHSSVLQFVPLYKAIDEGDWNSVKEFLERHPNAKNARISVNGMTGLHVATYAGHVTIAEELMRMMDEADLEIRDAAGLTVLSAAACNGMTKIAPSMVEKNRNLLGITDNVGCIPVVIACARGHKDMTYFLYSVTPLELLLPENGAHGIGLLNLAIIGKMFDIALDLVERCPRLATATATFTLGSAVFTLSCEPSAFFSCSRLSFWQKWIYSCLRVQLPAMSSIHVYIRQNSRQATNKEAGIGIRVVSLLRGLVSNFFQLLGISLYQLNLSFIPTPSPDGTFIGLFAHFFIVVYSLIALIVILDIFNLGIKQVYDMKRNHVLALELLRRICHELSSLDSREFGDLGVYAAISESIKNGITELIVEIIRVVPDLIWGMTKEFRNIFQSSVEFRQENIFSLIYGLDARKDFLITSSDRHHNNILHMAGLLAPSSQLARSSGAALQMQRELLWFKEVEAIVTPKCKDVRNRDGETPYQVFTRNHKDLRIEGEKWMKATATSSTVVGALIITIMFAAAFTVPGGNNQDTGLPIFLRKKTFKVFLISDAIALFASSTSVLMFLGILTSRYAEEDFLFSLPRKLIIGLSTLFLSIAAMVVTFCAAIFIMSENQLLIVVPLTLLACVPVTVFIWLQFPLLVEIFISTYGSGIFDRKMKRWY